MVTEHLYAPLHGWLVLLVTGGWSLPWVVEPMVAHHGHYSVLLSRAAA